MLRITPPGVNLSCVYAAAQKSDSTKMMVLRLAVGGIREAWHKESGHRNKEKYHAGNESVDFSSCSMGTYSDCASVPRLSMNVYSPESLFSWMNFLEGFSFCTT